MARILYIEDYPSAALTMDYVLQELGHECVTAATGTAAIAAYKEQRFDLVLVDTQLPDMDGPDVAKAIRTWEAETGHPRTTLLGFSADSKGSDAGRVAGMDAFAMKSLSLMDVKKLLDQYLKSAN
jgi:two-component system sensor histidine kinase EvgS